MKIKYCNERNSHNAHRLKRCAHGHRRRVVLRRGTRRTDQSLPLFRELSVRDNLFLAARDATRGGFSVWRPRAHHPLCVATNDLLELVRLSYIADELVSSLSHGQQCQLEIGMEWAGAPHLVLFDEPATGLSPAERRELVLLLNAFPEHMGFVLIEHDLEIALRVVERVTIMHDGKVLKHGTPSEIENDVDVQAIYLGSGARPLSRWLFHLTHQYWKRPRRLRRPCPCAAKHQLPAVGRNGTGKTTLYNAITGRVAFAGSIRLAGEELRSLSPDRLADRGIGYVPQG